MSQKPDQAVIQKSLRYSLREAGFWSLMVGFFEIYFPAFALFLGATDIVLGLLVTLPSLLGSLSLVLAPYSVRLMRSRKSVVLIAALGQALVLFLIPLWMSELRLVLLFVLSTFYWIFGSLLLPVWQSWMGQMVVQTERGQFFGRRQQIIQLATFFALVVGGLILDRAKTIWQNPYAGFTLLFCFAGVARIISFLFLRAQTDLPDGDPMEPVTVRQGLRELGKDHYGYFVFYIALFSVAVNFAAPYFIPYLLQSLQFSYFQFMSILAALFAVKFLTLPLWGRISDRFGVRKPLILAGLLFCLPPFLWLLSQNFFYLLIIQLLAGFITSGFELCSFNYMLDSTEDRNRTRLAAFYEFWMGLGITLGSVLGGLFLRYWPSGQAAFLWLFLISGLLRVMVSFFFVPKLREERAVAGVTYKRLFLEFFRTQRSLRE